MLTSHLTAAGGRRTVSRTFASWEEADAAARATSPATDGSMWPQVQSPQLQRALRNGVKNNQGAELLPDYSSGVFHNGSRYAAIIRTA